MAALPRMWRRRVSRRLATAAGLLAGMVLIGSGLAALNGSVLPFRAWPAPATSPRDRSVLLPPPPLQAQAPARIAAGALPAV
ncbi:MAG TPA: hypothetical protein VFT42_00455, partial [Solirubrobacteraceae bacterium]|nr:hypothetical protein [Solirubrobacteraceae bacterium]